MILIILGAIIGFVQWCRSPRDELSQDPDSLAMAKPTLHVGAGAVVGLFAAVIAGVVMESSLVLETSVEIQPLQPDVFVIGSKVSGDWVFRYRVAGEDRAISLSKKEVSITEGDTAQPRFESYRYEFTTWWYNLVGLPPVNQQFNFMVPRGTVIQEYNK